MKRTLANWMNAYGIDLIACGATGYLSKHRLVSHHPIGPEPPPRHRMKTTLPATQLANMKRMKHRDVEKTYPVGEFVTKLRRLADALESGRAFSISVAGERLRIPADARFNIEHEREGSSEELEFQLKWKRASKQARRKATAHSLLLT